MMINSHFCGVLWCFMGNDELCFSTSRFYMFLSSAESRGAVLLSAPSCCRAPSVTADG